MWRLCQSASDEILAVAVLGLLLIHQKVELSDTLVGQFVRNVQEVIAEGGRTRDVTGIIGGDDDGLLIVLAVLGVFVVDGEKGVTLHGDDNTVLLTFLGENVIELGSGRGVLHLDSVAGRQFQIGGVDGHIEIGSCHDCYSSFELGVGGIVGGGVVIVGVGGGLAVGHDLGVFEEVGLGHTVDSGVDLGGNDGESLLVGGKGLGDGLHDGFVVLVGAGKGDSHILDAGGVEVGNLDGSLGGLDGAGNYGFSCHVFVLLLLV